MRPRRQQKNPSVGDFKFGVGIDRGDALEGVQEKAAEGAGFAVAVAELLGQLIPGDDAGTA